jgi:hypothetical protein
MRNKPKTPKELATAWAKYAGSIKSPAKAAAARENGKKGGRPLGSKNKVKK